MIYSPHITNLKLCFMKGRVRRHTRSTLLISVFIPKLYDEKAYIVELLTLKKVDTQFLKISRFTVVVGRRSLNWDCTSH